MSEEAARNPTQGTNLAPDNSVSTFRIYALGTVAADFSNKSLEEDPNQTLEVFVDELMSGSDGKIVAEGSTKEVTGKDAQGRQYNAKAATTTSSQAFWLPFGTNRMTAPNLRKGMRVVLWKTADEEQLYWQPKGGDNHLMTLESVILVVSANPNPKADRKTIDVQNCYYFMVDSILKKIAFGTSMANGEITSVLGELNLADGYLQVADTVHENLLLLHFVEHMFRYQNKDNSIFDVTKENITVQCEDTLRLLAKKAINAKTKALSIESETVDVDCKTWTGKVSGRTMWKCPLTVFTGSVQFTGEDGQTVELNGNFQHKAGTWTSPSGTNVYTHDHGGVERGGGRTDPFR